MDPFLIRLLIFLNILNVFNTILNVIHKLEYIHGPSAHMAMAFLSIIILLGYSGILNTVFLKRKFHCGRIFYLVIAVTCQCIVLVFSFLSYYEIITYFKAIAIIHALFGFITMINFTAAVMVVHEQQVQMDEEDARKNKKKIRRQKAVFQLATKRASHLEIDNYLEIESILSDQVSGRSLREHLNKKGRKNTDQQPMMVEMQLHKDKEETQQSSVKDE